MPADLTPDATLLAGAAMDSDGGAALFCSPAPARPPITIGKAAPLPPLTKRPPPAIGGNMKPSARARAGASIRQGVSSCLGMDMRKIGIVMAALLLSGCAVGPDFKKPDGAAGQRLYAYSRFPPPKATPGVTGGEAQRFTKGGDIAGDWWTLYHSPALECPDRPGAQEQFRPEGGAGRAQVGA